MPVLALARPADFHQRAACGVTVLLLATLLAAALACVPDAATNPAAISSGNGIAVTARRVNESFSKDPVAVSAFNADQFMRQEGVAKDWRVVR